MSLKIRDYLLTGPFELEKSVVRANQDPCVYVIVEKYGEPWDPKFRFVAVGDSGATGLKFAEHPDLPRWKAAGAVSLYYHPCPRSSGLTDKDRNRIVAEIRDAMAKSGNAISIQGGF
ncbi:MAG: hypothetical protein FJX59_01820 [Alphaproteobacteria bacterium]|nr:hypothetical protein [Alphaproteobacteria bacterium]